ncbi:MAG: hypothetical protein ACTSP4_11420 [Candidatus Hodarchaeales archaeon]
MKESFPIDIEKIIEASKKSEYYLEHEEQLDPLIKELVAIVQLFAAVKGIFALVKGIKARKRLHCFFRTSLIEQLNEGNEFIFIAILNYARKKKLNDFLYPMTSYTSAKIDGNIVTLNKINHFILLSYLLLPCSNTNYHFGARTDTDHYLDLIERIIPLIEDVPELHDEFIPFHVVLLYKILQRRVYKKWFKNTISPLSVRVKSKLIEEIQCNDTVVSKRQTMTEIIIETISLKNFLHWNEDYRLFFDKLRQYGMSYIPMNFLLEDLSAFPLEDRLSLAKEILDRFKISEDSLFVKNFLSVDKTEESKLFNLSIPKSILYFLMNLTLKEKDSFPKLVLSNKHCILEMFFTYQKNHIDSSSFFSFISNIPEPVICLILKEPTTRAICRQCLKMQLISSLRGNSLDKFKKIEEIAGDDNIDLYLLIDIEIEKRILQSRGDKDFQEFLLDLQSRLLESQAGAQGSDVQREIVLKISAWLRLWSLTDRATQENEHMYYVNLLDSITELREEYLIEFVANKIISLKHQDLSFLREEDDDFRDWLFAIKSAYYKLQILANDGNIKLCNELRERFKVIAADLLAFTIRTRRKNVLRQIEEFEIDLTSLIDIGNTIRSSVEATVTVLFPSAYSAFPIPALRVLNELIKNPAIIPINGSFKNGMCIYPPFWTIGCAIAMLINEIFLVFFSMIRSDEYYDYSLDELMKTFSLVMNRSKDAILSITEGELNSETVFVERVKNLTKMDGIEFSREQVVSQLTFGGWDEELSDLILEKKQYCLYCSFELPREATTCPNCGKEPQDIELADISFDNIQIDIEEGPDFDMDADS